MRTRLSGLNDVSIRITSCLDLSTVQQEVAFRRALTRGPSETQSGC